MKTNRQNEDAWLEVLIGLSQVMRFCRQDEAFCEGVTFHQFMILETLSRVDGVPMREVHESLGVAKSTTTRLAAPLLEKKLMKRLRDPDDQRVVRLSLTPEGRRVHEAVRLCLSDFIDRALAHLPPGQRDPTLQALIAFIDAVKNSGHQSTCCGVPQGDCNDQDII